MSASARPTVRSGDGFLHLPDNSRLGGASPFPQPKSRSVAFLDRDGVLIEDVHFLVGSDQIRILPGVAAALRDLQRTFYVVVVSNQSGIARGFLSENELLAVHTELVGRLVADGVVIDALYYCPHLPDAPVAAYALECDCRKPEPGMLNRAIADWNLETETSFLVGDAPRDVEAARRAGIRGILTVKNRDAGTKTDGAIPGLAEAVALVLGTR